MIEILGRVIDTPFDVIIGEPDIIKYNLLPVLLFRYANMNSNSNTNINLVSSDAVDKSTGTSAVSGEFRPRVQSKGTEVPSRILIHARGDDSPLQGGASPSSSEGLPPRSTSPVPTRQTSRGAYNTCQLRRPICKTGESTSNRVFAQRPVYQEPGDARLGVYLGLPARPTTGDASNSVLPGPT
jgi:hypothetical protein